MPNLAQIKAPLRQLLRKDQSWIWDEAQATAFKKTQDLLASPPPPPPTPRSLLSPVQSDRCCRRLGDRHWSRAYASPGRWNKAPGELHLQVREWRRTELRRLWEGGADSHSGCREVPWLPLGTWLCYRNWSQTTCPLSQRNRCCSNATRKSSLPTATHALQAHSDWRVWETPGNSGCSPLSPHQHASRQWHPTKRGSRSLCQASGRRPSCIQGQTNRNCTRTEANQRHSAGQEVLRWRLAGLHAPKLLLKQYYTNREHFSVAGPTTCSSLTPGLSFLGTYSWKRSAVSTKATLG